MGTSPAELDRLKTQLRYVCDDLDKIVTRSQYADDPTVYADLSIVQAFLEEGRIRLGEITWDHDLEEEEE